LGKCIGDEEIKHIFGPDKPEYIIDGWPGQYTAIFSWLESLFTLPRAVSVITTCKENGAPNACPDAWGTLIGGGKDYSSLIAVYRHYHTFENILRDREWCINFPDYTMESKWNKTMRINDIDNDEITDAGFTVEPSHTIKAPRIAECLVNLECQLEWNRPLHEGSNMHLFCGRITALAMDDSLICCNAEERLRALDLSYLVMGQMNPLTGQKSDPSKQLTILQHDLHD
jgi:flavin reductase (DIM6/NTAB) family NADH-FMN oxidoreductase RutF